MNQDNSTAARGVIVGLGAILAGVFPAHATQIMQGAAALYALVALLKPFLPASVQSQV